MERFLRALFSIYISFSCYYISLCLPQNDPVHAARYTTQCTTLEHCDAPNSRLQAKEAFDCLDGVCICHPNASHNENSKKCECNEGFVKSGRACIPALPSLAPDVAPRAGPVVPPAAAAAPPCTATSCNQNEECTASGCVCKTDYVNVRGLCKLAARRVGDPCENDEQCKMKVGGYSSCEGGKCVCEDNSVAVLNGEQCMLKKGLLEKCTHEEQCSHIPNARCATDICLCRETHVTNDNSSLCLPVVNVYEGQCESSVQCHKGTLGSGTECVKTSLTEGKCVCMRSYFYEKDIRKCLIIRGHGEQCDNKDTGCYLPEDGDNQGIECKKNTCQCKKKYKLSDDKLHCSSAFNIKSSIFFTIVSLILTRRW